MKFSSMEKIAIFANESIPFVLHGTIFSDFLQETIILAILRFHLWNYPIDTLSMGYPS